MESLDSLDGFDAPSPRRKSCGCRNGAACCVCSPALFGVQEEVNAPAHDREVEPIVQSFINASERMSNQDQGLEEQIPGYETISD